FHVTGVQTCALPIFVGSAERERGSGSSIQGEPGLDAFLRLTPYLTLALTLNTDFAETEVDERRVNLTRFPLFFPERRDFFLQDEIGRASCRDKPRPA